MLKVISHNGSLVQLLNLLLFQVSPKVIGNTPLEILQEHNLSKLSKLSLYPHYRSYTIYQTEFPFLGNAFYKAFAS